MRVVRWLFCFALIAGALVAGERPASAQNCSVSTTSISFGVYDVFSTVPLASTGSLTLRCMFASTAAVWLGKGNAMTNNPRQMASGVNRLSYNLYVDANHTAIWGDPNPNHRDVAVSWWWWWPTTVTVYGLIPAGQDVPAGSYTDTVTVTINF
jgi:spore coat protein U-like protein